MAPARTYLAALAAALLLTPAGALAADRYGEEVSRAVSDAYAYRRVEGSARTYERRETSAAGWSEGEQTRRGDGASCRAYCLPPGYTLEPSSEPQPPPGYEGRPVGDPGVDYIYTDGAAARDDQYGERRTWRADAASQAETYREESFSARAEGRDRGWRDDDQDVYRCDREDDDRDRRDGRACGEIRLSDSFFYGTGGVGPEYIDAGGGGGGGAVVFAGAGAGASAYASARSSVGVSIRIGGGGRGRPGRPGGGHPPKGGCGCGH